MRLVSSQLSLWKVEVSVFGFFFLHMREAVSVICTTSLLVTQVTCVSLLSCDSDSVQLRVANAKSIS